MPMNLMDYYVDSIISQRQPNVSLVLTSGTQQQKRHLPCIPRITPISSSRKHPLAESHKAVPRNAVVDENLLDMPGPASRQIEVVQIGPG